MATRLPLSQGQYAVIDDADAEWLGQWKWSASRCHRSKFCAVRTTRGECIYMHRLILGLDKGDPMEADHINHDTLDNRRANLRTVTSRQNKQYQPSREGSSSRHVGVTWDVQRKLWRAQIQVDGVVTNLGRYQTEAEAALARDEGVRDRGLAHKLNMVA